MSPVVKRAEIRGLLQKSSWVRLVTLLTFNKPTASRPADTPGANVLPHEYSKMTLDPTVVTSTPSLPSRIHASKKSMSFIQKSWGGFQIC